MSITVNGKQRDLGTDRSVADLIRSLGYQDKRIAVERNGHIVPKSQHSSVELANGDEIEIVVAVGGG